MTSLTSYMKVQKNSLETNHELPKDFPHIAPENYHYESVCIKRNVIAIWIVYRPGFVYNDHHPTYSIWGFYNTKTGEYSEPISATKQGDTVDIKDTTPYSSMQLNLNPLEHVLYSKGK